MTSQPPGEPRGNYGQPGQPGWGQQPPPSPYGQSPQGQPSPQYSSYQQPYQQQPYQQQPYQQQPYQPGYRPQPPGFGAAQSGVASYGGPRPPKRRNPLTTVLLGLIGLVILALGGLVVANLVGGGSSVAYQNDNYQVPDADKNPPPTPVPETYTEAEQWVTENALYGQSVPVPVRCNARPIDVADADDAELETHFNGLMECLVRVWQPPLTAAGFQIVRPSVTIYGKEINTKCGRSGVNAFYCLADQQVYFSNLLPRAVPIVAEDKWAADVVMAHEFGHAIQGRTGIIFSAHALASRTDDKSASNAVIRRVETQADCFSGQFMRSVSQSLGIQRDDVDGILKTYEAVGDDTLTGQSDIDGNHGLASARRYWGAMGLSNDAIAKCNTFIAPPNLVR